MEYWLDKFLVLQSWDFRLQYLVKDNFESNVVVHNSYLINPSKQDN